MYVPTYLPPTKYHTISSKNGTYLLKKKLVESCIILLRLVLLTIIFLAGVLFTDGVPG